jgi:hypothetical protein
MSTSAPPSTLTGADYPADYVELEFTTDEQTLADDAVANLQTTWTGWEPNEGDVEVVLIETLAPYAAAAAQQASQMPPEAFIALGTKLYGIPIQEGVPASTTVTLTFQDDVGGYFVPAGSEFELSGFAFSTSVDITSAAGSTTVTAVDVVANDVGVAFNALTDIDWASVTLPVWVTDLTTEAPTSGGVDPQQTYDYLNMLSRELQLRGRMVVTLPDFEIVAVDTPGIGRAYAQTTGPRDVEVTLADPDGEPVSATIKDELTAIYQTATLVNVTFTLADATYTAIDVTYSAVALPGFDAVSLQASIDATLSAWLSPTGWGVIPFGPLDAALTTWYSDDTVRLTKVIATIGGVVGVSYVVANSVQINGAAADYVMPGSAPLPRPGTMTGTVAPAVVA